MPRSEMDSLPVDLVLPQVSAALDDVGLAVLQAPPGAGKTTRVPLFLLEKECVQGRILMLEPRRVAARAAADRLASSLGQVVGESVGYRIRGEARAGSRIEVITDGIFTRMIQSDPELPGVGCVIFDEFHERALQSDLGLALALEVRAAIRPDLKIVVMSATLDAEPVAELLGNAPVITSEGKVFPVDTNWLETPWRRGAARRGQFEAALADLVAGAAQVTEGGILVFLPGQREITRTATLLSARIGDGFAMQPLHGGLSLAEQRAALLPQKGIRKLVLATSIAETSLTIPDIRVVIDGGLARRAVFDPGSGMSRLVTTPVSRAEATQRQGRAGRVAPGWCFRMWPRGSEGALEAFPPPEIASTDLTSLALELGVWGNTSADDLSLLTAPPQGAFEEAQSLLRDMGAIDSDCRITSHGRDLARLPVHPRLAHMLLRASEFGSGPLAADLAALLEARDPVRGRGGPPPVDLTLRLDALRDAARVEGEKPVSVDRSLISTIANEAKRLRRMVRNTRGAGLSPGAVLSLAYPDRIGKRRQGAAPRYLLSGGKGAILPPSESSDTDLLVVAETDGDLREAKVRRALSITRDELEELHSDSLRELRICEWSKRDRAVLSGLQTKLGAIVLRERPWRDVPASAINSAMISGIREAGLDVLPWDGPSRRFAHRVEWLRARESGLALPDYSDSGLIETSDQWLAPFLNGARRMDDLSRINLRSCLESLLDWSARQELDRMAPSHLTAPTGTRLPVTYEGEMPSVSVRLQEVFGLTTHPLIGPDRIPVLFHLLSPARRPVQSTADIPGFWKNSYADVRRDMRGRYPKHFWPENPEDSQPTTKTRKRGA